MDPCRATWVALVRAPCPFGLFLALKRTDSATFGRFPDSSEITLESGAGKFQYKVC